MASRQFNATDGFTVGNTTVVSVIDANANVFGNAITATANVTAPQLISNVAIGTAPIIVTSTTVVANLNANALQGSAPATANTASTIALRDTNGNLSANFFIGNGSQLTGIVAAAGSSIVNGTSNVVVDASANVRTSVGGTANVLVVTATGANITGTANISGNLSAGNITTGAGSGGNISGANVITANTFTGNLVNGTSNVVVAASGNVTISSTGNLNILTVTGTGVNVFGTFNTGSGNANIGNIGTARILATANITAPQLISNIAAGTAPFLVNSNTVVANLNADLLEGFNPATANTASTIALRDANGNVSANFFIGNGSQLTGIGSAGSIANGTSNVSIPASGGNVNTSVGGTANVLVVTATGANITGTANISGNLSAGNITTGAGSGGNISGANVITANTFVGVLANGNSNVNIPAANGNVNISAIGNANIVVVTGTGVNVAGTLNATGNANIGNIGTAQVLATANITAPQLISNIAAGTAPLVVTSTTVVANLNANALQGSTPATANTASTIALRDTNGNLSANFFIGNGSQLTGVVAGPGTSLVNGTSNVVVASSGNVTISSTGNLNILTVTGTGVNVFGTLNTGSGNANVGNLGTAQVLATANITAPQLISNIAGGTAPLIVTSTTVVANLNANALQGSAPAVANTASTIALRDANGNVSANFFIGNGSQLTGIVASAGSSIVNGTSNVVVDASANVRTSVGGVANVIDATTTGVIVTGTFSTGTGNANVGNLGTAQVLATANITTPQVIANIAQGTAPFLINSNTVVANLNASLLLGATSATANTASTIALRDANGNVSANFFIGNGSQLTGIVAGPSTSLVNGTSNVVVAASGNVTVSAAGNLNILTVTGTGVNVFGTFSTGSGNANVGNLGTGTAIITTGNITTINSGLLQNGTSNVTITSGANISTFIGGNATAQFVVTATGANIPGTINAVGNANVGNLGTAQVLATANIIAPQLISNIAAGTAPLVVTSTTVVANLNANALQGSAPATANTASTIALRDANGNVSANFFIGNGSQLTGITGGSSIVNGTSNVVVAASGNITISSAGNLNILTVTGTGVNVFGTFSSGSGNANVGNLGTAQVLATANITTPQVIANIAQGTAPFLVNSTTKVANLNADLLDDASAAVANTASTIALRDANGNVSANFFIGNGSQLTGIVASGGASISNGTSNVNIPASGGNVVIGVGGTANVANITSTGVNVFGTLQVNGTINANATFPTVPFIVASTTQVTNLNAQYISGYIPAVNATATTIVARDANANVNANYYTGNGSLLTGISSIVNGTSNVVVAASGNVTISSAGNANVLNITGTTVVLSKPLTFSDATIQYKASPNITVSTSAPISPAVGDLWVDTT